VSDWEGLTPPYATIVADPPWQYGGGLVGTGGRGAAFITRGSSVAASDRYSTLSASDLCAMPVADLADDDAHLYLWTTNAFMVEAHDICRAWGFKPKTILTWVKTHHDDPTRVSMKSGHYFRGATEHVVFAVRGSLDLVGTDCYPTAFLWPRISEHSAKPDAFLDLVERVSPGPYVELFCRRPRLGWDHWGHGYEVSA
jgi:N6-adenosine-specific RNA methylase IME4